MATVSKDVSVMFFVDSVHGWAAGSGGTIYATSDGGLTWGLQNSGSTNTLRSLLFLDPSVGFALGNNRTILSTTNGGITWNTQPAMNDTGTIYTSLGAGPDGDVYFMTNYGGIFRSNMSGMNWQQVHSFGQAGFSYVDMSHQPVCFAMKASGNTLYVSTDNGTVWDTVQFGFPWSGDIFFHNKDTGWVTENWAPSSSQHDSVAVHFSQDGGRTWIRRATIPGLVLTNLCFTNGAEGWMSATDKILHTADGGTTWNTEFSSDSIGFIRDLFMLNADRGWAISSNGTVLRYSASPVVSVRGDDLRPQLFTLFQNHPNPFNPTTNIQFTLLTASTVTLSVYDILGTEVAIPVRESLMPGSYTIRWEGQGRASGVYFYRMTAGAAAVTKKMVLVR